MTKQKQQPLVVWRIVDGKPGHESQTAGLVQALGRLYPVDFHDVKTIGRVSAFVQWAGARFPSGRVLPKPDLIIGAGHKTHLTLLAAKRAYGGRTIVLMKPSLPLKLFDLCLIPQHDGVASAPNVEMTRGALNTIQPSSVADAGCGLFLIGGPSAHHDWDRASIMAQVIHIVQADQEVRWTLTTSPRTPDSTEAALLQLSEPNLKVVPFAQTERGWVAERLQECAHAWVSEDSVSMVYEALTAGARVGLLDVPAKAKFSRVQAGVEALVAEGYVVRFSGEGAVCTVKDAPTQLPFCEAERCARIVLNLVGGVSNDLASECLRGGGRLNHGEK